MQHVFISDERLRMGSSASICTTTLPTFLYKNGVRMHNQRSCLHGLHRFHRIRRLLRFHAHVVNALVGFPEELGITFQRFPQLGVFAQNPFLKSLSDLMELPRRHARVWRFGHLLIVARHGCVAEQTEPTRT